MPFPANGGIRPDIYVGLPEPEGVKGTGVCFAVSIAILRIPRTFLGIHLQCAIRPAIVYVRSHSP
jgi:hypothetical protein